MEENLKIYVDDLLEPYYIRLHHDEERIGALAESIKKHGLLHNIGLNKTPKGLKPVFGTRRIKALKLLGVRTIPSERCPHITLDDVKIFEISDFEAERLAQIENEHREDWSGVEKAVNWRGFMEKHGFSQEDMAEMICKSQSYVSQKMSLLRLPEKIQQGIISWLISDRHGEKFLQMRNLWKQELATESNQIALRKEIDKMLVEEYEHVVENNTSSRKLKERIDSLRYCFLRAKMCCNWTKDFENELKLPEQSIGEMLWKNPPELYRQMTPCDFCSLYCLDPRFMSEEDKDFLIKYSMEHKLFPDEVNKMLGSD